MDNVDSVNSATNEAIPPIETLIPHRGTMRLLDRIVGFDSNAAVGECTPCADAWYAEGDVPGMPAWIGLELMAQTIAAHVSLVKRRQGLPPKLGVLLGTRAYRAESAVFAAGQTLRIRVSCLISDATGLGAYDCVIEGEQGVLATAVLKVFEPEDASLLLQGVGG